MSQEIIKVPFVVLTKAFKIWLSIAVLFVLAMFALVFVAFKGAAENMIVGFGLMLVNFIIPLALIFLAFAFERKNRIITVYRDRVEYRSKFLTEKIRRIESAKIETVDVADPLLGQKKYGQITITGSGGSKIIASPVPNQHELAETIRSISNSFAKQYSPAENVRPVEQQKDFTEQLANLQKLRESGALTEAEFVAAKNRVLGS